MNILQNFGTSGQTLYLKLVKLTRAKKKASMLNRTSSYNSYNGIK